MKTERTKRRGGEDVAKKKVCARGARTKLDERNREKGTEREREGRRRKKTGAGKKRDRGWEGEREHTASAPPQVHEQHGR